MTETTPFIPQSILITAKPLVLATGAKRNTLALKELKKYEGSGISYCAICDGFFYREKKWLFWGNGPYALHEAKVLEPLPRRLPFLPME